MEFPFAQTLDWVVEVMLDKRSWRRKKDNDDMNKGTQGLNN